MGFLSAPVRTVPQRRVEQRTDEFLRANDRSIGKVGCRILWFLRVRVLTLASILTLILESWSLRFPA